MTTPETRLANQLTESKQVWATARQCADLPRHYPDWYPKLARQLGFAAARQHRFCGAILNAAQDVPKQHRPNHPAIQRALRNYQQQRIKGECHNICLEITMLKARAREAPEDAKKWELAGLAQALLESVTAEVATQLDNRWRPHFPSNRDFGRWLADALTQYGNA